MKVIRLLFPIMLILFASQSSFGQQNDLVLQYINQYKDLAIVEMQRTGVPAAIKLAQGIHETSAGQSRLVTKANNHFGIKCKTDWSGPSISHDDDARGECFRKYSSSEDSYRDHSNFLKKSARYASLFELDPTDYEGWAYGLKKAGYATNPKYPQVIIKLINDYNLQEYTLVALGKSPANKEVLVRSEPGVANPEANTGPMPVVNLEPSKPVEPVIYPQGVFNINETRVIFAKSGTSWLSLAQEHKVSLSRIFDFNDMAETEIVEKDQLVYLQRKRKSSHNDFHVVQKGETLHQIAQLEAIRMESLLEYNYLQSDMQPAIGEKLFLRGKAPAMPKLALKENLTISPSNMKWGNNQN
jgi:hypothetical protein